MKRYYWICGVLCCCSIMLFSNFTLAGTRDLLFEDEEPITSTVGEKAKKELGTDKPSVVSVKASLELTRDGKVSVVLPTYEFKSNDKVKILYTANIDSYVYWLSQGSSGNYVMLFPNSKTGTDNFIKKNEIHTIPIKGSFRFDETVGVEKILLIMSAQKIPELDNASEEASVSGGSVSTMTASVNNVSDQQVNRRKSRDLVFEEDDDSEKGIATMSQASTNNADPLVVYYELKHK